ncbi:hypothetical protein [Humibacter sp.]|uniref:hypothetical protein n=1 Tax=Humibacter sp. TaxID=1940291 RepID=UPI003F81DD81
MATNEAWGKELREARHRWQERHGRKISADELAARVAELLGSKTPYSHVAVGAWYKGTVPKEPRVAAAIIQALEGDPRRFREALVSPFTYDFAETDAREVAADNKKAARKKATKKNGGKRSA